MGLVVKKICLLPLVVTPTYTCAHAHRDKKGVEILRPGAMAVGELHDVSSGI